MRYSLNGRWFGFAMMMLGVFWLASGNLRHPNSEPTLLTGTRGAAVESRQSGQARLDPHSAVPLNDAEPQGTDGQSQTHSMDTIDLRGEQRAANLSPDTIDISAGTTQRLPCLVLKVADGDTLSCDINGNHRADRPEEDIRLLGIDSPEMHYSRKNPTYNTNNPQDEPYAKESSAWLTRQVDGKTLYLEFDQRAYDRYGRRLAYAYLSPTAPVSLNEQSLAGGYSQTLFLGKNRRHQPEFERAERQAQDEKRGLWGLPQ